MLKPQGFSAGDAATGTMKSGCMGDGKGNPMNGRPLSFTKQSRLWPIVRLATLVRNLGESGREFRRPVEGADMRMMRR